MRPTAPPAVAWATDDLEPRALSMKKRPAPLSPFWISAWRYTFFNPSVIHRAAGLALSTGLVLLVYFLTATAGGQPSYSRAQAMFGHPVFKVILVVWLWSFFFHLLNGIRHLVWDTGHGFERNVARVTGRVVIIAATILTFTSCLFVFRHGNL